ncbi:MAG: recombinase family protein [Clostridiales bacterium]|nr:recombinase family protein [Clostridiales bacterium]
MFESILEGYNKYYSAEPSAKVRRGLKESRIKGNFTGGYVLYGYDVVNKKLVINERDAEIVRKIYTDCANGVLLKNIAAELNEQGRLTKTNTLWTINRISRILNNEKYCGIVGNDDGIYTNIIPPIIDETLYKQVGLNMGANNRRTSHFKSPIPF